MNMRKTLLLLAALTAGTTVHADKVKLQEAPPAVQQAIRSRAGQQPIEDIDRDVRNGKTTYEASWKNKSGVQQELLLSDTGAVLRDVPKAGKKTAPVIPPQPGNAVVLSPQPVTPATPPAGVTNSIAGFTSPQEAQLNWATESVQNELKGMANGAAIEHFQKGQLQGRTAYAATYKENGHNKTVVVGEDGTVLASNPAAAKVRPGRGVATLTNPQPAPMNWASETVQNKFKQMANGATIENFQKGQFHGKTAYEGSFTQNGKTTSLIIGEDGSVLSSFAGAPTASGAPAAGAIGTSGK